MSVKQSFLMLKAMSGWKISYRMTGALKSITKMEGFIKRMSVEEFRVQNRGGKGVIGSGQKKMRIRLIF